MRKTLASLVAGVAGMLTLISGLCIAKIGFNAVGGDILIATILAFIVSSSSALPFITFQKRNSSNTDRE